MRSIGRRGRCSAVCATDIEQGTWSTANGAKCVWRIWIITVGILGSVSQVARDLPSIFVSLPSLLLLLGFFSLWALLFLLSDHFLSNFFANHFIQTNRCFFFSSLTHWIFLFLYQNNQRIEWLKFISKIKFIDFGLLQSFHLMWKNIKKSQNQIWKKIKTVIDIGFLFFKYHGTFHHSIPLSKKYIHYHFFIFLQSQELKFLNK